MNARALLAALFLLTATLVALAPAAEARQACTYGGGDPCDDHLVCVWNRLTGEWDCYVGFNPGPCPTRCDPT